MKLGHCDECEAALVGPYCATCQPQRRPAWELWLAAFIGAVGGAISVYLCNLPH